MLVQSRELVQITDFGLAKMLDNSDEDSVVVRTGRVPIRWLAIETLQAGIYSHKTDVWSYGRRSLLPLPPFFPSHLCLMSNHAILFPILYPLGVTLWEIFTFGKLPYENISTAEIKDHVMKGVRLSQPEICTLDTYMVMVRCKFDYFKSNFLPFKIVFCFYFQVGWKNTNRDQIS